MRLSATALLLTLSLLPSEGLAQDYAEILPGQVVELEKYSECRRLKNNAADRVFIPMKTPEEWSLGLKAFLSKTPPKIRKGPCVDYSLAARVWARPGPPGTTWPYSIDAGGAGITTLSTVGAATGGGAASKSGDQIVFNPGTDFRDLAYLESRNVTIPWSGIDFEGVPESGTATVNLVGYWEGAAAYAYGENEPDVASNTFLTALDGTFTTPETPSFSTIKFRNGSFDGDHVVYSVNLNQYMVAWAIILDNSIAARSTYTLGASAGNPNGDAYSNTMLDAQINAAVSFIDYLYASQMAASTGKTLSDSDGSSISISSRNNSAPFINVYTANSGLSLIASKQITTTTARDALKTALRGIKHATAANVNFNTTLSNLNTDALPDITAGATDFVNVVMLSPGVSNGTSFTTIFNTLNGTSTGQKGLEFFAFRSGASNAVINALDSTGTATALTDASALENRDIPHPVKVGGYLFAIRNEADTGWDVLRDTAGAIIDFPMRTLASSPINIFQAQTLRITRRGSWVCRTFECGPTGVTPSVVTDETRIKAMQGETTRVLFEYRYEMRPGYKAYNTRFAAAYNSGGAVYKPLFYTIPGSYRASPP